MNITVAVVTTKLVEFASEKAAQKWVESQKEQAPAPKNNQTVEYQIWNHPVPIPS